MSSSTKAERLRALIGRLKAGNDVAQRDLKNVLTPEQFNNFCEEWEAQKQARNSLREKPSAVVEYEKLLRKAIFTYNRAEGYNGARKKKPRKGNDGLLTHQRLYRLAEVEFESLLQYLTDQAALDSSLQVWFDRPITFSQTDAPSLDPTSVPRVVTSRSAEMNKACGLMQSIRSKREIKQDLLESALHEIEDELKSNTTSAISEDHQAEAEAEATHQNALQLRTFKRFL